MEDDGAKTNSDSLTKRSHASSSFYAPTPRQSKSSKAPIPSSSTSMLRSDGIPLSSSPNSASGSLPRRHGSVSSAHSAASSSADSSSTVGAAGGGAGDAPPSGPSSSSSGSAKASRNGGVSGSYVRVLFDYEYTKKDGTNIRIARDQVYHLVDKTNEVWWRVRPTSKTVLDPSMKPGKAFYLPANYVEIDGDASAPAGNSSNGSRNSSRNGSLKSASSSSSSAQQQQQQHNLGRSSTPPTRYENWSVKTKASEPENTAHQPAVMSMSLPPAAATAATNDDNNDYSSKKSVAEKRQSFELMSSSTSSLGSVTSHAHPSAQAIASALPFQPPSSVAVTASRSFKGATTSSPVAVPTNRHPDDYDEVDDESSTDSFLNPAIAHTQRRPLPRVPDPSAHVVDALPSSASASTAKPKPNHQQSSSYDSGIDNPCYARLDELKQQMMATSVNILGGGSAEGSLDKKLDEVGSNTALDAEDEKTGSSNTLDTEDSQSIPDLDVLEIGGTGRSSFKSNSKPVNLSSFKNPLYQQQQQQPQSSNPRESGGGGGGNSPLSSFGSLEKQGSTRRKMLSDSSDDVFEDFMKKSSLLNSFTAASTSSSSNTNAASSLKSKAATLAAVEPPRVPETAFFDSSLPSNADSKSGTKSLERDEQLPQRMESFGSGSGSVGGVTRQRPNSFNYMGVKGSGVDMGLLKNQLRKTSSREMLAEKEDDDSDVKRDGDEEEEEEVPHRRRTVEETRKSLEDLSAAVAAEAEAWKTKSLEHLIGGKVKKSRKEKLPPGWTKDYDSELERDVYTFKDGVRICYSSITEISLALILHEPY